MCLVTQHQCRRRQMLEYFLKFSQYTHSLHVTKNDLSWLNNLFVAKFQLIVMSFYAKNKVQMRSVTQHQCTRRQMWGNFSQIHPVRTHLSVTKIDLFWVNNLFIVMFQLHSMSSYAKNKLQLCSVSQRQCRRRQMWEKFHKFCRFPHFLSVTKSDLSWLKNLFMVNFQLIRMSSSAKNKQ